MERLEVNVSKLGDGFTASLEGVELRSIGNTEVGAILELQRLLVRAVDLLKKYDIQRLA